jgi:hypothetical protein
LLPNGDILKTLHKRLKEINNANKIMNRINLFENKFRSLFDLMYAVIKKNRDNTIIALRISLNTVRYNLFDEKKEIRRTSKSKIGT